MKGGPSIGYWRSGGRTEFFLALRRSEPCAKRSACCRTRRGVFSKIKKSVGFASRDRRRRRGSNGSPSEIAHGKKRIGKRRTESAMSSMTKELSSKIRREERCGR